MENMDASIYIPIVLLLAFRITFRTEVTYINTLYIHISSSSRRVSLLESKVISQSGLINAVYYMYIHLEAVIKPQLHSSNMDGL